MLKGTLTQKTALKGNIQSRIIEGGGGGTTNYNQLSNKPKINGVELKGDKSSEELGLASVEALENKLDKTTEPMKIYGTDRDGNAVEWTYQPANNTPNTIVGRDVGGRVQVATPKYASDATTKNYVDNLFNGASKPITYDTYSEMITALNSMTATDMKQGQDIFIVQTGIPDVWVAYVEETSVPYTYVDDNTFVNELLTNGVLQVGYYKLGYLETQKVDLTEYVKNTDYATSENVGLVKVNGENGTLAKEDGTIVLYQASNYDIDKRNNLYKPITPFNLDYAVKKSLSDNKLTGDNVWTDEEKTNARTLVGAVGNTDYATSSKSGVVKAWEAGGIGINSNNGNIYLSPASQDVINNRSQARAPITVENMDYAVKVGLTTNTETLTDEEKAQAQSWLGVTSGVSQEDFDKLVNNETQIKTSNYGFSAGGATLAKYNGVAIGKYSVSNASDAIAIGVNSEAQATGSVSLGYLAKTSSAANYSIQLGIGTNVKPKTLQVRDDNIYNCNTHTLTVQNIELNGEDLASKIPTFTATQLEDGSYSLTIGG